MQVTVYATTTCPYCKMLKKYLEEKNIAFTERFVDQDEAAHKEMMKESSGFLGVPYTVVTKDDGTKESIIGFDKEKINQVLGIS